MYDGMLRGGGRVHVIHVQGWNVLQDGGRELRGDLGGEKMFGSRWEIRIGKQGSIILPWWGITRRTGRRRRIPAVGIVGTHIIDGTYK